MAKKTLGNGSRIISTHTRNIDNKRADERPVGGGIVVPERSGIFAKDDVFDEDANDSQSPSVSESMSANSHAEVKSELM